MCIVKKKIFQAGIYYIIPITQYVYNVNCGPMHNNRKFINSKYEHFENNIPTSILMYIYVFRVDWGAKNIQGGCNLHK